MSLVNTTDATEEDLEVLRCQLGRVPRGVVGIAARCVCGRPTVVATAPRLPDGAVPHDVLPDAPGCREGCLDS